MLVALGVRELAPLMTVGPRRASSAAPSPRSSGAARAPACGCTARRSPVALGRPDRAEPPPLRRLHRAPRHAGLLRGVRRHGVQGAARGHAQARRVDRAQEPVRPHLHASPTSASRSSSSSTATSRRRRSRWRCDGKPDGRIVSEKRQHVTVNELGTEEASFEPSTEVGIRSGLREDLYIVFAGAGERHRGGGLPLQHQSAGLVGLGRRLHPGVRRAHHHVARRRNAGRARAGTRRPATGSSWRPLARARSSDDGPSRLPVVPAGFRPGALPSPARARARATWARCSIPRWRAGPARRPLESDNDVVVRNTELKLQCTCGCTLDIFTCRTTDFTCTYSPALHREIVALSPKARRPSR